MRNSFFAFGLSNPISSIAEEIKKVIDLLSEEGDQWLLEEPFIWEKDKSWECGEVECYPARIGVPATKDALKAGRAINAIIKGSVFNDTFVSAYRENDMMILSFPELWDLMIPLNKGGEVVCSRIYNIDPKSCLWVNGEEVDAGDKTQIEYAGLWHDDGRCHPKNPVVSVKQGGSTTILYM